MEIIVKGKGIEFFTPNEVSISINFNVKEQSYEDVLSNGIKNVQNFINNILLKNGFNIEDMKTRAFAVREENKYDDDIDYDEFDDYYDDEK